MSMFLLVILFIAIVIVPAVIGWFKIKQYVANKKHKYFCEYCNKIYDRNKVIDKGYKNKICLVCLKREVTTLEDKLAQLPKGEGK